MKVLNWAKMKNERNFTEDKAGQLVPMETSLATMQGLLKKKRKKRSSRISKIKEKTFSLYFSHQNEISTISKGAFDLRE